MSPGKLVLHDVKQHINKTFFCASLTSRDKGICSREVHELADSNPARATNLYDAEIRKCRWIFCQIRMTKQGTDAGKARCILPDRPLEGKLAAFESRAQYLKSDALAPLYWGGGQHREPERRQPVGTVLGGRFLARRIIGAQRVAHVLRRIPAETRGRILPRPRLK